MIIAAHPDDEVLGCGGTIAKHVDQGHDVSILIIAEGYTSRSIKSDEKVNTSKVNELKVAAKKAANCLGIKKLKNLDLPDNRLDSIDRLELIKLIEAEINATRPKVIYTHHSGDVNIDHRRIHEAVITACRPTPTNTVRKIISFEVPSSTEWQTPGSNAPFTPNLFINIENQLSRKLQAINFYKSEMREWPHSRSAKAVKNYALCRGSQSGCEAAEAFMILRSLE